MPKISFSIASNAVRTAKPSFTNAELPQKIVSGVDIALPAQRQDSTWSLGQLAGRLTELSGLGNGAQLSLAFSLVVSAQREAEPVAWITQRTSTFFPPDAAASGVDLSKLSVIFVPDAHAVARAADRLLRSGGFGLLVLDFVSASCRADSRAYSRAGVKAQVAAPLQSRLNGLAKKHDAAVLCLTSKMPDVASLGSLISLRCHSKRDTGKANADDRLMQIAQFKCQLSALKDKHRGPGWSHEEICRGPAGLH